MFRRIIQSNSGKFGLVVNGVKSASGKIVSKFDNFVNTDADLDKKHLPNSISAHQDFLNTSGKELTEADLVFLNKLSFRMLKDPTVVAAVGPEMGYRYFENLIAYHKYQNTGSEPDTLPVPFERCLAIQSGINQIVMDTNAYLSRSQRQTLYKSIAAPAIIWAISQPFYAIGPDMIMLSLTALGISILHVISRILSYGDVMYFKAYEDSFASDIEWLARNQTFRTGLNIVGREYELELAKKADEFDD